MATAPSSIETDNEMDPSAGMIPISELGAHHPAGTITAFDEETGLPIVRRSNSSKISSGSEAPTVPEDNAHNRPVGSPDPETGRPVLQPTDDAKQAQNLATAAAPELTSKLDAAAQAVGGAKVDAVRDKKDPERVAEKVEKDGKPVETVPDLLAARISVDSPEARTQMVDALKKQFPVVKEEDFFEKGMPGTNFHTHTLQVKMANGSTAEVQIVPKEVLDVNDKEHKDYEKARDAETAGKSPAKFEAAARQKNDTAMEKFEDRNAAGSPDDKPTADPPLEPKGIVKGDKVRLNDGRTGTVAWAPGPNSAVKLYRVKLDKGGQVSTSASNLKPAEAPDSKDGAIYVDLDKTLARFHHFAGPSKIGPPEPAMVDRIRRDLADGKTVKIFTARVSGDHSGTARNAIEAWTKRYFGQRLPVTNKKGQDIGTILDDHALHVVPNTGEVEQA